MAGRNYGTDPFGIISRGDPSARGGSSVSVGRVGNSMRDLSGRSVGSGVGATVRVPIKTVSKANGGAAKSGCSVKAYGDMIKKQAGGPVSMPDYRTGPTATGVKMKNGGVQTSSDTARKLATEMGGMACGGKPVKKAKGGAGKVRKGMMSPSGKILQVVKPKKNMM